MHIKNHYQQEFVNKTPIYNKEGDRVGWRRLLVRGAPSLKAFARDQAKEGNPEAKRWMKSKGVRA